MTRTTDATTTGLRRCIGSTRFGIEPHDASVDDFAVQPAAKDGLGRMCLPHWTTYTRALRQAALERKAAEVADVHAAEPTAEPVAEPEAPTSRKGRRAKAAPQPEAVVR